MTTQTDIRILFEDRAVVCVLKPAGLVVHQDGRTHAKTLAEWFAKRYPFAKNVGEPHVTEGGIKIMRPGIVHRLDRDTSGVMLLAKTQESFLFLKKQFQERRVKKEYRAVVWGMVTRRSWTVKISVGRSKKDFRRWAAKQHGRPAETSFLLLRNSKNFSYLAAFPLTGRTHQIRVHLSASGYPVVCDRTYAPRRPCPTTLGRLALHAYAIEFESIDSGRVRVIADEPDDILNFLAEEKIM